MKRRVLTFSDGALSDDSEVDVPEPEPTVADRLAAVEHRLDRAANAPVTQADAVKIRDGLKPQDPA